MDLSRCIVPFIVPHQKFLGSAAMIMLEIVENEEIPDLRECVERKHGDALGLLGWKVR